MADMVDCGYYTFSAWARQNKPPCGVVFENRTLGKFDPIMTADEANIRSDHIGKITEKGQQEFKRGWKKAQAEYLASR
ncbi:MAG: hypothetical protein JJT87_19310 [Halomonas sp.]|nr:hypothetical protein [Halomonas sp.]MCC5904065.1 hypothetical protein [Halomonas sp.]